MADLAAHAAPDAAVVDGRDRVLAKRVGIGPDGQRRTTREADAAVVAGAGVRVHPEPLPDDPGSALDRLLHRRLHPPLAVELAFGLGDDDLRPLLPAGQRLAQGLPHFANIIGPGERPHPGRADAADRGLDRVPGPPDRVGAARGQEVLAAGRRRIAIVDDQRHAVVLVEHGIADPGRKPVVPEAAVAHHRDRAPVAGLEGRGASGPQAVPHRRVADVERRKDREEMAADVGRHVELPELALEELHRREDRPFGATGAQAGGTLGDLRRSDRKRRRGRRLRDCDAGRELAEESREPLLEDRAGIFPCPRKQLLADEPRLQVGAP